MTIYLVRHAHAGSRHDWTGDDTDRPLSTKGKAQSQGLLERLEAEPVTRVLSSPYLRCQQSVAPLARKLGLPVEVEPALAEGARNATAMKLIDGLAAEGTVAVLCSHGDVIPEAIASLMNRGVPVHGRRNAAKGSTFVLETRKGKIRSATYVDPPEA